MKNQNHINYIDRITELDKSEFITLFDNFTYEDRLYAEKKAQLAAEKHFGKKIYIRGLIEVTNYCKNDCLYCGIRCSNRNVERFRMSEEQIMECCRQGHLLGIKTFVLQGGEDAFYNDERLCRIISEIHRTYPECAVTLSFGERSAESYRRLFEAGADRYLLRHETANPHHYSRLHPENMNLKNRISCLNILKKTGFQTGCGIMVGSPCQTSECLADDMIFMRDFNPQMAGIGPFLPQSGTPFGGYAAGSVELTLFIMSLIRLMLPDILLPSTTALGSAEEDGRIKGVLAGANVYMPNLSPAENRDKYLLYDKKAFLKDDAGYVLKQLEKKLSAYGYRIDYSRGDYISKDTEKKLYEKK